MLIASESGRRKGKRKKKRSKGDVEEITKGKNETSYIDDDKK